MQPPCSGDVVEDSIVNVQDLVLVITSWGPCPGGCPADLNGDEVVDIFELIQVIVNWGLCP